MSESGSKKYIGVDLGAWYNNKTKIAILKEDEKNKSKLVLVQMKGEQPLTKTKPKNPEKRNKELIELILSKEKENALIAIDAPFAIPSPLNKDAEDYYDIKCTPAMKNQYLFDNSARFVYEKTQQSVLAPTATLVGALTSRMVHIVNNYFDILGVCKTNDLEGRKERVLTVEVFPTATLYQIIKFRGLEADYLEQYTKADKKDKDPSKYTKIKSYKKADKNSSGYFNYINEKEGIDTKKRMLRLIEPYIGNLAECEEEIKTDDDYDAIICALTAYWVDTVGYEKPDSGDLKKFTNSFIYIPKIDIMTPK